MSDILFLGYKNKERHIIKRLENFEDNMSNQIYDKQIVEIQNIHMIYKILNRFKCYNTMNMQSTSILLLKIRIIYKFDYKEPLIMLYLHLLNANTTKLLDTSCYCLNAYTEKNTCIIHDNLVELLNTFRYDNNRKLINSNNKKIYKENVLWI